MPLLLIALFFLAVAITASYYLFVKRPMGVKQYFYEEFHSERPSLSTQVSKIDQAVYGCLLKNNVPKKNIRFATVVPRHEKTTAWDFTELVISIPKGTSQDSVEEGVKKALRPLKPEVTHKSEKTSEGEKVLHVFALGLYTHKIRLAPDGDHRAYRRDLPRIAILIDDVGNEPDLARSFIQLGLPVTLSILPLGTHTSRIVQLARELGCEYMLHLPMEPRDYPHIDPGPGALFRSMGDDQIRQVFHDHLKRVPGAMGVNNHMGSGFTEDEEKMALLIGEIKRRALFYVDSRTTSETVAHRTAKGMGVPVASRAVFLDNDLSTRAMEFQLGRLLTIAKESGSAIGIGHPHKETLGFLKKHLQEIKTEAKVVPVSHIVG
jgi:hypothetical protein